MAQKKEKITMSATITPGSKYAVIRVDGGQHEILGMAYADTLGEAVGIANDALETHVTDEIGYETESPASPRPSSCSP